ncbi:hypothetical protein PGTDC60_2156 [Porphyromonas gingivalis TDC60]|nr:hypothetical protein PGTDC60_2156 [Porphyromonas gingivalis TDC60]
MLSILWPTLPFRLMRQSKFKSFAVALLRQGITNASRLLPKIRAKKVFNNEAEFGMILNKHLKGNGF